MRAAAVTNRYFPRTPASAVRASCPRCGTTGVRRGRLSVLGRPSRPPPPPHHPPLPPRLEQLPEPASFLVCPPLKESAPNETTMSDYSDQILALLRRRNYSPLKPK